MLSYLLHILGETMNHMFNIQKNVDIHFITLLNMNY